MTTVYVEGETDVLVAVRVAQHAGLRIERESVIPVGGYGAIDTNLAKYRAMASPSSKIWVLRDCDPTAPNFKGQRFARCAGRVVTDLGVANSGPGWCFRLARHEAEAWLLADAKGLSDWLRIPAARIPEQPDEILKAKLKIVELARSSGSKSLRRDLVPVAGSTAQFGMAFEDALQRFVTGSWSPSRAAHRSPSLRKCIAALKKL